jgi:hypothetical protein
MRSSVATIPNRSSGTSIDATGKACGPMTCRRFQREQIGHFIVQSASPARALIRWLQTTPSKFDAGATSIIHLNDVRAFPSARSPQCDGQKCVTPLEGKCLSQRAHTLFAADEINDTQQIYTMPDNLPGRVKSFRYAIAKCVQRNSLSASSGIGTFVGHRRLNAMTDRA